MYSTRQKKLPINGPFNGVPFYENGARAARVRGVNNRTGARPFRSISRSRFASHFRPIVWPRAHFPEPAWTADSAYTPRDCHY